MDEEVDDDEDEDEDKDDARWFSTRSAICEIVE